MIARQSAHDTGQRDAATCCGNMPNAGPMISFSLVPAYFHPRLVPSLQKPGALDLSCATKNPHFGGGCDTSIPSSVPLVPGSTMWLGAFPRFLGKVLLRESCMLKLRFPLSLGPFHPLPCGTGGVLVGNPEYKGHRDSNPILSYPAGPLLDSQASQHPTYTSP